MKDMNYDVMEENKVESNSEELKYTLKQAVYIVENIYREHEENDFNELIPSWYEALKESQRTFMQYKKMDGCPDYVDDYLEYCDYLFKTMTPLKLHKLVL